MPGRPIFTIKAVGKTDLIFLAQVGIDRGTDENSTQDRTGSDHDISIGTIEIRQTTRRSGQQSIVSRQVQRWIARRSPDRSKGAIPSIAPLVEVPDEKSRKGCTRRPFRLFAFIGRLVKKIRKVR
jgi:hypothetical protein